MNAYQYLSQMRAAGYRFYVIEDSPRPGILTLFPTARQSRAKMDRVLALESWQRNNCTRQELMAAIRNTPADPVQPHNLAGRNSAA